MTDQTPPKNCPTRGSRKLKCEPNEPSAFINEAHHEANTAEIKELWEGKRHTGRIPAESWLLFLQRLSEHGNIQKALDLVGISRTQLWRRRRDDVEFRAMFHEAQEIASESLEDEAQRRAVEGVEKPVFWQGGVVGHQTEYSDGLLTFLLKGLKPEKYRERVSTENINLNVESNNAEVRATLARKLLG